jgi:hypothetical protein
MREHDRPKCSTVSSPERRVRRVYVAGAGAV